MALAAVAGVACRDAAEPVNPVPVVSRVQFTEEDTVVVTVTGHGFVPTSAILFRGASLSTRYVSPTQLEAWYVFGTLTGAFDGLVVVNPPPGGGQSSRDSVRYSVATRPAPELVSISPAFVLLGADSAVITLNGNNFNRGGGIHFGAGDYVGGAYVSRTRLTVVVPSGRTRTARLDSLYVDVAPPGGGRTRALSFEVRAPKPEITGLRQPTTPAGQPGFEVLIDGTGFIDSSVVSYGGSTRPARRIGTGTLAIGLTEADLWRAGVFPIVVTNAGPGGGVSAAASFTITGSTPRIRSIPTNGGTVGQGFVMTVHGSGFVPGAFIRWNGADRSTTYVSSSQLSAVIPGADVAIAGLNSVVVRNTPPEAGESNAVTFRVRPLSAGSGASQLLDIDGMGIVWAKGTGKLYATVRFTDGVFRGRVVEIDPGTGTVLRSVPVASDPDAIAISDDEQQLYVVARDSKSVKRVSIATFVVDRTIALEPGLAPFDIEVLPGRPGSFAVSHAPGELPAGGSGPVMIYDDGVPRKGQVLTQLIAARLEFAGDSSTLYAYDAGTTSFALFRLAVDGTGARRLSAAGNLLDGFATDILGAQGRIYGTDGAVVDAERLVRVGVMGSGMYSMMIDADLGRAYAMFAGRIAVYDMNSFALLGNVAISEALGVPKDEVPPRPRMVRCGSDCIAWTDTKQVVLARSPMFAP